MEATGTSSAPEILFVTRLDPIAASYMPLVVDRCLKFCRTYDTHTRLEGLYEQLWQMFGWGDIRLGMWIVVQDGKIVGHLFAQPEPIDGPRENWQYVLIRQAEVDRKVTIPTRHVMSLVEQWTQGLGLNKLVMLTHRNGAAMARRWGFQQQRILMEKVLPRKEENVG